MFVLQAIDFRWIARTSEIAMQNTTTPGGKSAGERPEKVRLMQMVQKTVAHNQIRRVLPIAVQQLLQRAFNEMRGVFHQGCPGPGQMKHGSCTINADHLRAREGITESQGDVSWTASEINHTSGGDS